MGFGPAYGGSGGANLIVATRSDTSNPAVFSNFAALEAYTATETGTTDASRINVASSTFATEVFAVGTLNVSNQVTGITAAYIRLGGEWVSVATNLIGSSGEDGIDGVDGNNYEFIDIASRDAFFTARKDLLIEGLPITVNIGENTVSPLVWVGATNPPSYEPVFWVPASLRTGTSSLELGGVHTISSGGENIFFINEAANISYFPAWQSVGDHSTVEGQVVQNVPTHRVYGDLQEVEDRGPVAATGQVDYNVVATIPNDISVFGLRFIPAEDFTGQYEYRVTETLTNTIVYSQVTEGSVSIDTELIFWFDFPVEGLTGDQVRAEIIKEDGTHGQSRPVVSDQNVPYIQTRSRTFADTPLASSTDIVNADWDETDPTENSHIQNKPTIPTPRTDEEIRDVVVSLLQAGTNITIVEDDEADTLIINSTSTNPSFSSPAITSFSISGQDTGVPIGTTLSGDTVFTYSASNVENISGNLTLTQTMEGGTVTTLSNSIGTVDSTVTLAITTVTLAAGESVFWTLSGTDTQSNQFSRSFTVATIENLYHGLSDTNNPATVDLTSLTAIPVQENAQNTVSTGVTTEGQFFILLVPNDRDITSIIDTVLNQNVTDIFTKSVNVRTGADGVVYNSYVIGPLTAGSNESYIVRL